MRTTVAVMLLLSCVAVGQQEADVIFRNGRVYTMDAARPTAEAVAVKDGKILSVGSDADVMRHAGTRTRTIDLSGRCMLPGFIDSHVHFMGGGFQLQSVDLRDAKDESEFAARIVRRAKEKPGRWITGGDWDHDRWPGGRLPTRESIDAATPATPVFVSRYDGHMGLANTHVLTLAGITRDTPDPPGGAIVRDARTGEPTGILKDEAMSLVWRHVPDASEGEMLDAARGALEEARRYGITTVHDVSSESDVALYRKLRENGELTLRIHCRLPIASWRSLAERGITAGAGDDWITLGSLKAFADGSLGSSTALFFEPYVSDSSTRGLPSDIAIDGRLARWSMAADSARLQLSIHAIGDSANSAMLDLFERIVAANPQRDRRFRIEHAQHIHPKDFARFASLGVIASVQPYHAIDDGRWAEGRIGKERCRTTYPFATFLSSGVRMAFGSDWTVAPIDPLLGIDAAVNRRTIDGKTPDGWFPEQRISVEEAVRAYTINGAYASYEEERKGSITPGKVADLVLLDQDLFRIDPGRLLDVHVDMTVVGGKTVYARAGGGTR